jgi:hypothetical protein
MLLVARPMMGWMTAGADAMTETSGMAANAPSAVSHRSSAQ